jgi:hypothetical protein
MAVCAVCKANMKDAPPVEASRWAIAFQSAADETVSRRRGIYGSERLDPAQWFLLARRFIGLLRRAAARPGSEAKLIRSLKMDITGLTPPATGLALEILPVAERAALFSMAQQILVAEPAGFLNVASCDSSATATRERSRREKRTVASERRQRQFGCMPRSRISVMRKWARLQRKMPVNLR